MNLIVCPTRNNLHLLREAVRTFRAQDIAGGVHILIHDNGSRDGTAPWLVSQDDIFTMYDIAGISVAASWNRCLTWAFSLPGVDYALVVNNDVELRPDTYRRLVEDGGGFVTAVGTRDRSKIKPVGPARAYPPPDPLRKRPHPDFSCYLIRRQTFAAVGQFDERFLIAFCEDWDYHVRLHQAGITAQCLDLPFLHLGSQTIKNADDKERQRITMQAERNRTYFYDKWHVQGGSQEYYALFGQQPPVDEDDDHDNDGEAETTDGREETALRRAATEEGREAAGA